MIDAELFDYDKPNKGQIDRIPDEQRKADAVLRERVAAMSDSLRKVKAKITTEAADDVPCIHARMTVAALRDLAHNEAIGVLLLDDRSEVLDLGTSVSVAHTDRAHTLGFNGTGVRVAVFEIGPEQHGEPHVRRQHHHQPPAADPRTPGSPSAAVHPATPRHDASHGHTPGLPALLGEQQATTTRSAGPAQPEAAP